jgi:hypothetical protein
VSYVLDSALPFTSRKFLLGLARRNWKGREGERGEEGRGGEAYH